MLDKLIQLKDSLSPTGGGNTDPVMFDYKFWTDLESLAKKRRETSKDVMLALVPPDKMISGNAVLKSTLFRLMFEESKPIMTFDLEKMIDTLLRHKDFKKHRVFIRQAALDAKVPGNTKKIFRVERREAGE